VVVFGGAAGITTLGETWTWDGTDWTRHTPAHHPPARFGSAMASRNHVILFGGYSSRTGFSSDTWTWDGSDWTRHTPAHRPDSRDAAAMVQDSVPGQIVLFGGSSDVSHPLADTWVWDGVDWTQQ
jgi:hypothetical protein